MNDQSSNPAPGVPSHGSIPKRTRREKLRRAAALLLGVVITLFALFNLDEVKVHWVVTTSRTPLIVVIAASLLLGVAFDRALALRSHRRALRRAPDQS